MCAPIVEFAAAPPWTLRRVLTRYWRRVLLTYGLFNLENLLRLAQPLVLAWAINDLLAGAQMGLWVFLAQHIAYTTVGMCRRAYDTRVFTSIYADLATSVVAGQRAAGVETSRVAARSGLSRAFVDFFEHDVPMVVRAAYSVVGALVLLALFDPVVALFCLGLAGPVWLVNRAYGRKMLALNRGLHDELEREIDVIDGRRTDEIGGHYTAVGRWRVRLSDGEAVNFGIAELFILGLMAATLVRTCALGLSTGDTLAVFQYLLMFLTGVDSVPLLVQQLARLRDVGGRLGTVGDDARS